MFRILWRKKVLIIFLAALVILFPAASIKPAQMLNKTLLLSIGIDKVSTGYEISGIASVNKFSSTGETSTKPISAIAGSVNAALKKIEANQGREVSLAHCNLIVVGKKAADENLASVLHHFLRQYEMSNNALIIYTDSEVKGLLESSIANKTGSTAGLLETIAAQQTATLDEFYKNYLRPSSSGIINVVNLNEKELENTKEGAVFKNGKKVFTLTADQMQAVNMINNRKKNEPVILDADGNQVILNIKSTDCRINTKFRNGSPVVKITIDTVAQISEILNPNNPEVFLNFEDDPPYQLIKDAYQQKLIADTDAALEYVKTHKADFLRLYDRFHKYNTASLARYMKLNNADLDTFLTQIEFYVDIKVKIVV